MIADSVVEGLFQSARVECGRAGAAATRELRAVREREAELAAQPPDVEDGTTNDHAALEASPRLGDEVLMLQRALDAIVAKAAALQPGLGAARDAAPFTFFAAAVDAVRRLREKLPAALAVYSDGADTAIHHVLLALLIEALQQWLRSSPGGSDPAEGAEADTLRECLCELRTLLPRRTFRHFEIAMWDAVDATEEALGAASRDAQLLPARAPPPPPHMLLGLPSLAAYALFDSVLDAEGVLLERLTDFEGELTTLLLRDDEAAPGTTAFGAGVGAAAHADPLGFGGARSLRFVVEAAQTTQAAADPRDALPQRFIVFLRTAYFPSLLRACTRAAPRSVIGRHGRDAADVLHDTVYRPLRRDLAPIVDAAPARPGDDGLLPLQNTLRAGLYRVLVHISRLREQSATLAAEAALGTSGGAGPDGGRRISVGMIEGAALQKGLLTGAADFRSAQGHAVFFIASPADEARRRAVYFYVEGHRILWKVRGDTAFREAKSIKALLSRCSVG